MNSSVETERLRLNGRQRLTWFAHFFKAFFYQYHREFGVQIANLLPADGVVIDVGAHSGQFAKLFGRLVPQGAVYAFEPSAYALSILRPVLRWRGFRNVRVVPFGLSDKKGSEVLNLPMKKSGTVGFGNAHIGAETRPVAIAQQIGLITLDDFVAREGLEKVDFIKVDIEGWEVNFLRGALGTIGRFRPILLLEVMEHTLTRVGASPGEIFDLLAPLGYRIFRVRERDGYKMVPVEGFAGSADYFFIAEAEAPRIAAA
ncbi:methyltransferase FkbM family [Parvibaculum lavamentivorans DS-1]|uniref:Methyltransferase FkbM family n=1 Tax=Parvibaculum lavamentivorans (strain DS-1 / DSM 13023 / NCIMB 13966) TaxID=402881 RepID=A7HSR0_PARL1|nr:FkbM family methyltransferase [Parvibaculum lavamentivorans]ABS62943.1 methyltransferase FkbM family [Parvibaculum lavamentivorans DS-1]